VKIPLFKPWVGQEEVIQLRDVINSKWLGGGEKSKEFEMKVAELCGTKRAVATSNGTTALYTALRKRGI